MTACEHIHTPHDGRGLRRVTLNGQEIKGVVYADTKRGIVRVTDDPPKLNLWRKRVITRQLRGVVEVVSLHKGVAE